MQTLTYQRGAVASCLRTPLPNRTWHVEDAAAHAGSPTWSVRRCSRPGFPHGVDQVISWSADGLRHGRGWRRRRPVTPSAPLVDATDSAVEGEPHLGRDGARRALHRTSRVVFDTGKEDEAPRRQRGGRPADDGGTDSAQGLDCCSLAVAHHRRAGPKPGSAAVMVRYELPGQADSIRLLLEAGTSTWAQAILESDEQERADLPFAIWSSDARQVRPADAPATRRCPRPSGSPSAPAAPLDIATFQHVMPMDSPPGVFWRPDVERDRTKLGSRRFVRQRSAMTLPSVEDAGDARREDKNARSIRTQYVDPRASQIVFGDTRSSRRLVKSPADLQCRGSLMGRSFGPPCETLRSATRS